MQGMSVRIQVSGHGERQCVFLGRVPVTEVRAGDFVGAHFMGGLAHLIVRIGGIEPIDDGGTRLVIDWHGFRDRRAGGSLLPDDIPVPANGSCRQVWRLET